MRKRKVMIMSLKDSMIRGLALSGMDAIARAGYADSKMFADIINAAKQGRSLNLANNPVHEDCMTHTKAIPLRPQSAGTPQ